MQPLTDTLIILDSVDSTNNYAMGLIHSGMAKNGIAVMALHQTAGKGRLNKHWNSAPGQNITLSFILDSSFLPIYKQFDLSLAASLACVQFFKDKKVENLKIKWPNDIYFNDKKAGGILIENIVLGQNLKWTVIGIGININQLEFEKKINATSLSEITGLHYDLIEVSNELKTILQSVFEQLKTEGSVKMLIEYNSRLFGLNRKMKLKKDNTLFETTITGVNSSGELLTKDMMERSFQFNEIEWIFNRPS